MQRSLDKKAAVRREALEGLAALFRAHCAQQWKAGLPLSQHGKKFSWIPRKLLLTSALSPQTGSVSLHSAFIPLLPICHITK